MHWFYLAIAIGCEVVATTAMRAVEGFTRLQPSILVVVGYGLSFYFMSLTLRAIPVGITYAVWSGIGIVLISLVAWRVYGQTLDLPAMMGIGLILSGVLVINIFSRATTH